MADVEEAIKTAERLAAEYATHKTWCGNWMVCEATKNMMDTWNEVFGTFGGRRIAYSMNCRPCIGKVVVFLMKIKQGNTPEYIYTNMDAATDHLLSSLK